MKDNGKAAGRGFSRVVLVALAAGVLVHLAGFTVFRVVFRELPGRDQAPPFIRYAQASGDGTGVSAEWEQGAALLDSAPLFVPTRWNASAAAEYPLAGRVPPAFGAFQPDVDLTAELEPFRIFTAAGSRVGKPDALLDSRFWRFFERFGERPLPLPTFPGTGAGALVEVIGAEGPALRLDADYGGDPVTPVTGPAEFVLRTGFGDLSPRPVLLRSSGNTDFDAAVAAWLERPAIRARLPEGYARVRAFP
jgi:hypothetical protein